MRRILILMATHNGAQYLPAQLKSIAEQTHSDWRLLISDDNSSDQSRKIIEDFAYSRPTGQVVLLCGPCRGASENFRSLLRKAELQDDYLAFCDQDDVWEKDHLSRALEVISDAPLAIYGCRMRICDAELNQVGLSPPAVRPLSFRNALLQNMLSGNTMVMTPAAARVLQEAEQGVGPILIHDWWAYQIVTGAGGLAILDDRPGLFYRQHRHNLIGMDYRPRTIPARLMRHLQGTGKAWAKQNCAALMASAAHLTPENRHRLLAFSASLSAPPLERVTKMRQSGAYYQNLRHHMLFLFLLLLGRF